MRQNRDDASRARPRTSQNEWRRSKLFYKNFSSSQLETPINILLISSESPGSGELPPRILLNQGKQVRYLTLTDLSTSPFASFVLLYIHNTIRIYLVLLLRSSGVPLLLLFDLPTTFLKLS